jgi:UDP-N-acetylmuramyl pentapeptide phosphotransferase/UDP-N-acetylglucosamine-1-phosphate transferase
MAFFLSLLTSFIISFMMLPSLIKIAAEKNIFDEPAERKLHMYRTPLLGGIAIFAGTMISFLFWSVNYFEIKQLFILTSLLILFIAGFIDDLQPMRPVFKLFLQVVATFITVVFSGITIQGMHGLAGIHMLPGILPFVIAGLFILMMINAFNFIDGVDGLASLIGIISSALFGILFLSVSDNISALLAFSLCGSLIAFLIYNFPPAKIFMGDTGTLVTGFILSLLAIRLTEVTRNSPSWFSWLNYQSAPVFVLSALIIPTIDLVRVTVMRMIRGHSPIRADKNHIHHMLIALGLNSSQTTILLITINLCFILAAWLFRFADPARVFFGIFIGGIILSQIPFVIQRLRMKKVSR